MSDHEKLLTDVGKVASEFQLVDHLAADLGVTLNTEAQHTAERVLPQEAFGILVRLVRRQTGVRDPSDLGVLLQPPAIYDRLVSATDI